MLVKDVMTKNAEYIEKGTMLKEAAVRMKTLGCGFLPVGDGKRLCGVITDRDIAIRAVADGKDPAATPVEEIATEKVLYCYEGDNIEDVARNMGEQQVWRLIVLDNQDSKQLSGVLSVGDMTRRELHDAATTVAGNAQAA